MEGHVWRNPDPNHILQAVISIGDMIAANILKYQDKFYAAYDDNGYKVFTQYVDTVDGAILDYVNALGEQFNGI